MDNLVSIITPLYNSVEFLEDTYKSIVSQTYSNWEWVVTDDMSTDGSWELLRSLAEKDSRIVTFRNNKNLGAGASRNFAIKKARGRFIAFFIAKFRLATGVAKQRTSFDWHRIQRVVF